MSTFDYYFYYYSAIFSGYPLVIKIAIIIIFILFSLIVISFFRFFYIRRKQILEGKRKRKIDRIYRDKLIDILYFSFEELNIIDFEDDMDLKEPKKGWQKRMLTYLILDIKADKSFEIDGGVFQNKNYYNLLSYLKLFDYWVNEISSRNTSKAIRALRMANEIGEGIRSSAFSRSVHHRNGYLRKLARMTFTRFDAHAPYKFLEKGFDNHFNKFDKRRLHYTLIEVNKDHPIPLLSKWITNTTNDNYCSFLIREMGFFSQEEGIPFLVELFRKEQSQQIQGQIMETLGELKYEPLVNLIKEEFKFASLPLQTNMIVGLKRLKSESCLPFMTEAYYNTQFSEIKIQIVELLQEFDQAGLQILTSLSKKSGSKFEENLFNYALNYPHL